MISRMPWSSRGEAYRIHQTPEKDLPAFDIELAQDLIFDHPPDRSSRGRSPLLLIVREDDIEYLPFLRSS